MARAGCAAVAGGGSGSGVHEQRPSAQPPAPRQQPPTCPPGRHPHTCSPSDSLPLAAGQTHETRHGHTLMKRGEPVCLPSHSNTHTHTLVLSADSGRCLCVCVGGTDTSYSTVYASTFWLKNQKQNILLQLRCFIS